MVFKHAARSRDGQAKPPHVRYFLLLAKVVFIGALLITSVLYGNGRNREAHAEQNAPLPKAWIKIDLQQPAKSFGIVRREGRKPLRFRVGFGRRGVQCEGARFKDGYSLLGTFEVNALLSSDTFKMSEELRKFSPRGERYLREHLFANMNSIDFDNDGRSGEYGGGFISLKPLSPTPQPFNFGEFKGRYRWYSYAIHGTNTPERLGSASTGGCINVGAAALRALFEQLAVGDQVQVFANGSFTPTGCYDAR
ncbi:MAG: L,D-transpeptidase [Bdellovibrionales bacterium]|nr:L,D-transpeptidase [Bdellovibrionales bacterium]